MLSNVREAVEEIVKSLDLDDEFIRLGQIIDGIRHNLTVPPALEDYALRHGAQKGTDGQWFWTGAVPNELLCFVDKRGIRPAISFLPKDVKYCPHCGSEMVIRKRRENPIFKKLQQNNAKNAEFWGCTSYPSCTKTLPIEKSDAEMKEVKRVGVDKEAIAELSKYAVSVLGSPTAVDRWMFAPKIALGRKKPVDFLFSEKGRVRIRSMLDALYYTTNSADKPRSRTDD